MKPALRLGPDGSLRTNLSKSDIDRARAMFGSGLDTKQIADEFRASGLDVWECDVSNALARRSDGRFHETWPAERVEALQEGLNSGLTAREVAESLETTRHAVLGKISRLRKVTVAA